MSPQHHQQQQMCRGNTTPPLFFGTHTHLVLHTVSRRRHLFKRHPFLSCSSATQPFHVHIYHLSICSAPLSFVLAIMPNPHPRCSFRPNSFSFCIFQLRGVDEKQKRRRIVPFTVAGCCFVSHVFRLSRLFKSIQNIPCIDT